MSNILPVGFDTLRFFIGDGREIQMRRQYSASWEIVPSEMTRSAFIRNPRGHLEMGRTESMESLFNQMQPGDFQTDIMDFDSSVLYSLMVSVMKNRAAVEFYSSDNVLVRRITPMTNDETTFRIIRDYNGEIRIVCDGEYKDDVISSAEIKKMKMYAGEEHTLTGQSMKASVVIDDSGLIRPYVRFSRAAHTVDYVRSWRNMHSSDGIVTGSINDAWIEIGGAGQYHELDNKEDIIERFDRDIAELERRKYEFINNF